MILPFVPFLQRSANQLNMNGVIKLLRGEGHEIRLIAKSREKNANYSEFERKYGIQVFTTPYVKNSSCWKLIKRLFNPLLWDGESYAYAEKNIQALVKKHIEEFAPNFVWVSYTYLWPFRHLAKKKKTPFIVRSHNFEPMQLFWETGGGVKTMLKFLPKLLTEWFSVRFSDFVFAISPKEEKIYKILGAKKVSVLPSAALPFMFSEKKEINDKRPLNLLFMGSNYDIPHNSAAVEFLLKKVMPEVEKRAHEEFVLRITGEKLPERLKKYLSKNIIYEGFVGDLGEVFGKTDIAVTPSILGGGMQLKIFEPLACGIPTITSPRGLAGYEFKDGEDVLLASSADEFVEKILMCRDIETRRSLSKNALAKCHLLFSKNIFITKIKETGL